MFAVKDIVRPGETVSSASLSRRAGGKGANQAVAVSKAGGCVALIGAIGHDGVWVKDQLKNFNVEVGAIEIVDVICVYELDEIFLTPDKLYRNRQAEL
jgi:ribokinase